MDHATILGLWAALSDLAADIGAPTATVRQWRNRNSIPARRWPMVVASAQKRGVPGVTLETLAAGVAREAA